MKKNDTSGQASGKNEKSRNSAKHELVASVLRKEILEAGIAPGARLASEGELCERFNSSRGPIRQALATLEREALIYRVQGAGSFVAERKEGEGGHGRKRQRITVVLGFGTDAVAVGVGAELIEGLNRARREIAPRAQLAFEFGFEHLERFLNASPVQIQAECDGLLVLPVSDADMELTRMLVSRRVPVVGCFRKVEGADIPQVYIDQDEGAVRATEFLLRYGHRKISLLTALGENYEPRYDAAHRLNGYRAAFDRMGVPVDRTMLVESTLSMDSVMTVVTQLLERPPGERPTALMVGGILLLAPCLVAIHRLGLRVPEDLSVVAFDDSQHAQFHAPPLTVVSQRADKAARAALKVLLDRIAGGAGENVQLAIKPELILRDSCQPL
ncbi:GntR family transcriptional regulator [Opitutaceae bacterium TAV5]|nr:GntR family transcriptional regulator [Opitutaceae bacterium TAV5]